MTLDGKWPGTERQLGESLVQRMCTEGELTLKHQGEGKETRKEDTEPQNSSRWEGEQ